MRLCAERCARGCSGCKAFAGNLRAPRSPPRFRLELAKVYVILANRGVDYPTMIAFRAMSGGTQSFAGQTGAFEVSNIAGKAYGMNVITPMRPGFTWLQRFIFMLSRARPVTLAGLLNLSIIHFARWVLIKRDQWPAGDCGAPALQHDYMLFCSNFNGTWDQYIDAFADGIPNGLDLFWYCSLKYPHSIPITPFKAYIVRNQFYTNYYYNAIPGSAQRDVKAALNVYAQLKTLAQIHRAPGMTPETFAAAYRKFLVMVQNSLGSPGFAPIASLDTWTADRNRLPFVVCAPQTRADGKV
jgi:hypothetical protein